MGLTFATIAYPSPNAATGAPTTGTTLATNGGNGGTTYSCYSDSGTTLPTPCGLAAGQTIYIVLSQANTQAKYGNFAGTFTSLGSTKFSVTAPASIIAQKATGGVVDGPNDNVFNTDISALPTLSLDASWHHPVAQPGATDATPGTSQVGSTYTGSPLNWQYGSTTSTTILDGSETGTLNAVSFYDNPVIRKTYPDTHLMMKQKQENGNFRNALVNTNGSDSHIWQVDPINDKNNEMYQILEWGYTQTCNQGAAVCTDSNMSSVRVSNWFDYVETPGQTAANIQDGPLEPSLEDFYNGYMNHASPIRFSTCMMSSGGVWPSTGSGCGPSTRPPYGTRWRLKADFDLTGVHKVTMQTYGSGYTAGQTVYGTVADCPGAQIIAFAEPDGAILHPGGNGGGFNFPYVFVNHTGASCASPGTNHTITFDTPSGGTAATGYATTFGGFTTPAYGNVWINAFKHYGAVLSDQDVSSQHQMDTNSDIEDDPAVLTAMQQWFSILNPYLMEAVDATGYDSGGVRSANDIRAPWATNTLTGASSRSTLWQVDSGNALIGSSVKNQSVVKLTATSGGVVSYLVIPQQPEAFGMQSANMTNRITTVPDISTQINWWVTGLSSKAGAWSIVTSPCSNQDTITNSGLYTACPAASITDQSVGMLKFVSSADPNLVGYVRTVTLPAMTGTPARLALTTYASKLTDTGGTTWIKCTYCFDTVHIYVSDYNAWPWASYPGPGNTGVMPNGVTISSLTNIPSEAPIYKSAIHTYGDDIRGGVSIPNGHYWVRLMMGEVYNGDPSTFGKQVGAGNRTWLNFGTQGSIKYWAHCPYCKVNMQEGMPVDVYVPATVTNGTLYYGLYGHIPVRDATAGVNNVYLGSNAISSQSPQLAGVEIVDDQGKTTPHWEMGSWTWRTFSKGDEFQIAPSGQLQMYVRNVFTSGAANVDVNDNPIGTWSVRGGGTIDQTGMYTAPSTSMNANNCPVVTFAGVNYSASHAVCMTGGTVFSFR